MCGGGGSLEMEAGTGRTLAPQPPKPTRRKKHTSIFLKSQTKFESPVLNPLPAPTPIWFPFLPPHKLTNHPHPHTLPMHAFGQIQIPYPDFIANIAPIWCFYWRDNCSSPYANANIFCIKNVFKSWSFDKIIKFQLYRNRNQV